MTIHHDIALALAVLLVVACIVSKQCGATGEIKDIINFATTIAVATFAHAQGARGAMIRKTDPPEHTEKP